MASSRQTLQQKVKMFRQRSRASSERDVLDQLAEALKGKVGDVVSQGKAKVLTENLCVLLMDEVEKLRVENFALKRSIGVSVYENVDHSSVVHDNENNGVETRCASSSSSSVLSRAPSQYMPRECREMDEDQEFEDEELGQQIRQRLAKRGGKQEKESEKEQGAEDEAGSEQQMRHSLVWSSDDEDWELGLNVEQTRIYRRAFSYGILEPEDGPTASSLHNVSDPISLASSKTSSGRQSPVRPENVPPLRSVDRAFLLRAALNMGEDHDALRPRRCSSEGSAHEVDFSADLRHLWDSLWGRANQTGGDKKSRAERLLPPSRIRRSVSAGDAEHDHL